MYLQLNVLTRRGRTIGGGFEDEKGDPNEEEGENNCESEKERQNGTSGDSAMRRRGRRRGRLDGGGVGVRVGNSEPLNAGGGDVELHSDGDGEKRRY